MPTSISNELPGAYLDDYVTLGLNHYPDGRAHSTVFDRVSYTHTRSACSVEGRLVPRSDIGGLFFTSVPGVPARDFTVDFGSPDRRQYLVIVVHADRLAQCRITRANYHFRHWGIPTTRSSDVTLDVGFTHTGRGPSAERYTR